MTKAETLAALERAEKATPDWQYRHSGQFTEGEPGHEETHEYAPHIVMLDKTDEGLKRTRFIAEFNTNDLPADANAEFATAARTDVPKLAKAYMEAMRVVRLLWAASGDKNIEIAHDKALELLRRYEGNE